MIRPLLMCFVFCVVYGSPKPTKKDRVHHDEPLSPLDHNDKENYDFDHEAFLGHDEADTFTELSPEESKRRLGIIVDKMDSDRNSFVTEEELKAWITHVQRKHVYDSVEKHWKDFDMNKDGFVSWEEYRDFTYSNFLHDPKGASDDDNRVISRDERRFKVADRNGDMRVDKEELTAFLHPEEFGHMKDVVAQETIEDMDKDKDGFVSVDEYLGDMYPLDIGEEAPEWIGQERKQFTEHKDQNGDGKLDKKEVMDWIFPDEDHVMVEAQHLLNEADASHDGKLTKEEILDQYMVFVGSQVTSYGEALHHDEF